MFRLAYGSMAMVLLFAVCAVADDKAPEFKEFTSKDGRFSARFPGTPQEEKESVSKDGPPQFQFVVGGPTGAYLVSYQDNANLVNAGKPEREKALQTAQDTVQRATQGKLLRAKEITLEKVHPGREYEFQVTHGPGGIFRCRAYLVKDRLYQVIAVGQKEFATSKDADRFLDSFQLLK